MRRFTVLILMSCAFSLAVHADKNCEDWFRSLKLKPGTSECEIKCSMAKNGMGTFDCTDRCEDFCHFPAKSKCKLEVYWQQKLNAKAEPFSRLASRDRRIVERALSKMPRSFRPSKLKAIAMASGNGGIITGYSPAVSSDEYIILFPSAFAKPIEIPRILAHELAHFLSQGEWAAQFRDYQRSSGWKSNSVREGGFVESDGKSSPEEDFANNIEFYLFERATLKAKSPEILVWLEKNMSSLLKLEKECQGDQ